MAILISLFILSLPVFAQQTLQQKPMKNWTYKQGQGDYYKELVKEARGSEAVLAACTFKKFPVRYFIGLTDPDWYDLSRQVFNEYKYFFNMVEVSSPKKADIALWDGISRGLGDSDVGTKTKDITIDAEHCSYLLPPVRKALIRHEIGHAMGIHGHSPNPNDLMFYRDNYEYDPDRDVYVITDTGQVRTEATVGTFTVRDLNTLWRLYNSK